MTTCNNFEYNEEFYSVITPSAINSAEEIIPMIINLVRPQSVIDIGCGIGAWLSVWDKFGIKDYVGVDGNYINTARLLIDRNKFLPKNLERGFSMTRKFDLVTSLEVAEHLNKDTAEKFVETLCNLGNVILFSAAIPGQEGTHHLNEQYPSYWNKLFMKNDFILLDCIRSKIWTNEKIDLWYRQNILLFVKKVYLNSSNELNLKAIHTDENFIDLVHPQYFNYKSNKVIYYENLLNHTIRQKKHSAFLGFYDKLKRKINSFYNLLKRYVGANS